VERTDLFKAFRRKVAGLGGVKYAATFESAL